MCEKHLTSLKHYIHLFGEQPHLGSRICCFCSCSSSSSSPPSSPPTPQSLPSPGPGSSQPSLRMESTLELRPCRRSTSDLRRSRTAGPRKVDNATGSELKNCSTRHDTSRHVTQKRNIHHHNHNRKSPTASPQIGGCGHGVALHLPASPSDDTRSSAS